MNRIVKILMERDSMSQWEAKELFNEAQEDLQELLSAGESADDICEYWFGLEPDYIFDLMEGM